MRQEASVLNAVALAVANLPALVLCDQLPEGRSDGSRIAPFGPYGIPGLHADEAILERIDWRVRHW